LRLKGSRLRVESNRLRVEGLGWGGDIEDVLVGVGLLVLLALSSHEHPQRKEVRLLFLPSRRAASGCMV